jgi:hypothetical protein
MSLMYHDNQRMQAVFRVTANRPTNGTYRSLPAIPALALPMASAMCS